MATARSINSGPKMEMAVTNPSEIDQFPIVVPVVRSSLFGSLSHKSAWRDTLGERWWFDTIVPGLYPVSPRTTTSRSKRSGGELLTTQLYFPGEPGNERDRIFSEALLLDAPVDVPSMPFLVVGMVVFEL